MQIILAHNTSNFKQYFDNVEVKYENPIYESLNLDLSKLADGDYTLTLYSNRNEILAKELVRIGDYQVKEYKVEKKYKTYARK